MYTYRMSQKGPSEVVDDVKELSVFQYVASEFL